ncbi:MAG TPA: hypothetical protein VK576_02265, partial [Thermoleophilia bacterium]|nr:hypothetical protein [Thermoleophilia bacterium]
VAGAAVRFSGRVASSSVDVFVRYHRAIQPYTLKATGWRRIAHLTSGDSPLPIPASHDGFVTKWFHPRHTAWYVARYASPYFPAFTQVVKVNVR